MSRDQVIGILMLIASIAGIIIYGWIVFFTDWFLL
ncbi:MAG: transcriptional regulator, partial [Thaumarchaeota archaeon]